MERQLGLHTANLLAVAIGRNCDRAIHIAEFCRFAQRERRNALAGGKLESVGDQCVIFVTANFDFVRERIFLVFFIVCTPFCS